MAGWWHPRRGSGVVVALLVLGLVGASVAFSAGLTVTGGPLASGRVDTPCDADGVSVVEVISADAITRVDVSGIAAACGNGTLSVTVRNGSAQGSGSAAVPAGGGGPVAVAVSPTVTLTQATSVFLLLRAP